MRCEHVRPDDTEKRLAPERAERRHPISGHVCGALVGGRIRGRSRVFHQQHAARGRVRDVLVDLRSCRRRRERTLRRWVPARCCELCVPSRAFRLHRRPEPGRWRGGRGSSPCVGSRWQRAVDTGIRAPSELRNRWRRGNCRCRERFDFGWRRGGQSAVGPVVLDQHSDRCPTASKPYDRARALFALVRSNQATEASASSSSSSFPRSLRLFASSLTLTLTMRETPGSPIVTP